LIFFDIYRSSSSVSAFAANLVMNEEVAVANSNTVHHHPKPKVFQHFGIIIIIMHLVQLFLLYYYDYFRIAL